MKHKVRKKNFHEEGKGNLASKDIDKNKYYKNPGNKLFYSKHSLDSRRSIVPRCF